MYVWSDLSEKCEFFKNFSIVLVYCIDPTTIHHPWVVNDINTNYCEVYINYTIASYLYIPNFGLVSRLVHTLASCCPCALTLLCQLTDGYKVLPSASPTKNDTRS